MHLTIKFNGLCRPPETLSFLETHFRDAVLDHDTNIERLKHNLYKNKLESWYIQRIGRQAINPYLTDKEKAKLTIEWRFE